MGSSMHEGCAHLSLVGCPGGEGTKMSGHQSKVICHFPWTSDEKRIVARAYIVLHHHATRWVNVRFQHADDTGVVRLRETDSVHLGPN